MTEHELKTWVEYFQAIKRGEKTFELRRNDRDFQVGDILHLREWHPVLALGADIDGYTGEELRVRVTYVLSGCSFGLAEGYVAMSIRPHVRALTRAER